MRAQGSGSILNISSTAAVSSVKFLAYKTSKAGVNAMTQQLAIANARYGIRVNAIMPGAATRMTDTIPEGRLPGTRPASEEATGTPMDPANVPPLLVFLASDEAAAVNGQCFGASGYRITRYTHVEADRILCSVGPWDIDHLFKIFKSTLGTGMQPPRM